MALDPRSWTLLPQFMDASKLPDLAPGELLRLLRTTVRMTQEQLARRSGMPQAHITRMEAGVVDAQWKTWVRLFEAIGGRLLLKIQAEGGTQAILEVRIQRTARQRKSLGNEKRFPDKPLSDAERQAEEQEWKDTLRNRRTSEIWDEGE